MEACDDCDLGAVRLARKPDVGRVSCDNVAHSAIALGFSHRPFDNGVWRDRRFAHKDVSLATALGREIGVPMRMANLALEEMTEAMNRGWGNRDSRSPMILQLERAGVEIAVDKDDIRAALERDGVANDNPKPN